MRKQWIYTAAVLVVALVLQETAGFKFVPTFGNGGGNGGFGNQVDPATGIIYGSWRFESCGRLSQRRRPFQEPICTECFSGIARICATRDTRFGTFTTTAAPPTTGPTTNGSTTPGSISNGPTSNGPTPI